MEQIKDIIPDVIKGISLKNPDLCNRIQLHWQNINNRKTLQHTTVAGLEKECLMIHVDSPAWLFQLKFQKNKLENQMKEEIPEISKIKFRIGKLK